MWKEGAETALEEIIKKVLGTYTSHNDVLIDEVEESADDVHHTQETKEEVK